MGKVILFDNRINKEPRMYAEGERVVSTHADGVFWDGKWDIRIKRGQHGEIVEWMEATNVYRIRFDDGQVMWLIADKDFKLEV